MRKLSLQMQMSHDGFVCGPEGELDWIFQNFDDESHKWIVDRLPRAGAHLMGCVTYGDMAAHWPTSDDAIAPLMNDIPKIVFSRTLKETPWGETSVLSGDLATEIARLKAGEGKELVAHGGASFARSLVNTGLIDEYVLFSHPAAIGRGRAIFSEVGAPLMFRLAEAKTFATGLTVRILQPKN